jgi:hypothetical protein
MSSRLLTRLLTRSLARPHTPFPAPYRLAFPLPPYASSSSVSTPRPCRRQKRRRRARRARARASRRSARRQSQRCPRRARRVRRQRRRRRHGTRREAPQLRLRPQRRHCAAPAPSRSRRRRRRRRRRASSTAAAKRDSARPWRPRGMQRSRARASPARHLALAPPACAASSPTRASVRAAAPQPRRESDVLATSVRRPARLCLVASSHASVGRQSGSGAAQAVAAAAGARVTKSELTHTTLSTSFPVR